MGGDTCADFLLSTALKELVHLQKCVLSTSYKLGVSNARNVEQALDCNHAIMNISTLTLF